MDGHECERRFGHNWYVRKFGGAYCTRCSTKAKRFCNVNGKPVANHCYIDAEFSAEGETQ